MSARVVLDSDRTSPATLTGRGQPGGSSLSGLAPCRAGAPSSWSLRQEALPATPAPSS